MYIYVYIHMCIHIYVYVYMYVCVSVCVHIYVHIQEVRTKQAFPPVRWQKIRLQKLRNPMAGPRPHAQNLPGLKKKSESMKVQKKN